jgi:hypothetical protein
MSVRLHRRASGRIRRLARTVGAMSQDLRGRADPRRDVRPRPAKVSQATYWRRRVVVLAIGAGVVTGIAWAANGLLALRSTADQGVSAGNAGGTGPAAPHASGVPVRSRTSPAPSPDPSPSRHRTRSHALAAARDCAPGAVTLRISSPQYWYQAGTNPRFTVHVISQAAEPCRFNMGAGSVSVVVAAVGRPVWNSADCASGAPDMVVLTRGGPAVRHVSWDRMTSPPGCGGITHPARAGEYQVTAAAGRLRSPAVNVVLGAAGASGP